MTGLSSVAGTPLQAKVQSDVDSAARGSGRSHTLGMVTPGQAVVTLLRSAVQSSEFCRAEADRQRAETQSRFQAETEETQRHEDSRRTLGHNLDVTA